MKANANLTYGMLTAWLYGGSMGQEVKSMFTNLTTGLLNERSRQEREGNKPLSAGRGGTHCCKTSAMGQMADNAVKTVRQKRERMPYKPIPQMHALYSLEDLRRY